MKTISGSILASKSITLSKAASSINSFLSMETGATVAVSSYLQRCAVAFNELVQDHQELKAGRSTQRKHNHNNNNKKKKIQSLLENANATEEEEEENHKEIVESVRYPENSGLGSIDDDDDEEKKTMETKKISDQIDGEIEGEIDEIERESGGGIEVEEIKEKKKKKKRKKPIDDSEERQMKKKKKKRKHEREET